MRKCQILLVMTVIVFTTLFVTPLSQGYETTAFTSDINVGPYIDKLVYKVISSHDERIQALQAGTIDMDNSFFEAAFLTQLEEDPEIAIFNALRNGYGHFTINCRNGGDGALADARVRRAFAYAFDKTAVTTEIMGGFSREQDSLVPYTNSFCIEDELEYHYYTDQTDTGNDILTEAGYLINEDTGWRDLPDGGGPFSIDIWCGSVVGGHPYTISQLGVDALERLHINATRTPVDCNMYLSTLDSHGDYDMVFHATNFGSNDVDWLAYEYWSEYANTTYQNPTNFANATYDSWRDQLLYSTTYEEVYEAAAEMQKILHYNVPLLVVYENTYLQAYRNDTFTGHVEDLGKYISGPWTMRKIHLISGEFGGTVTVAIGDEPDSFNFFTTDSIYLDTILLNLYSSLYRYGPNLRPYPDLAETLLIETHAENIAVSEGRTRFTIDIIQNATWSDGTPLTAEDIVFTFTYIVTSASYGNPAAADLGDLQAVYSPRAYRVVFEFAGESYWHFSNFAFDYIIPKHIFSKIPYSAWDSWNPVLDPDEPHVTCGPFILTDFIVEQYYELTRNPQYHYTVEYTETTTTTTNTTTNQTAPQDINALLVFTSTVSAISTIVILYCTIIIVREKYNAR